MKQYDKFTNNVFAANEWSAPSFEKSDDIKALLDSFNLKGRTVKSVKTIGLKYNFLRERIEDTVFNFLSGTGNYSEAEMHNKASYNYIEPEFMFDRYSEIDEPVIIEFQDRDTLEIDTPISAKYRISMNKIPYNIDDSSNNVDDSVLYSPCIGRTIEDVEVKTYISKIHPLYFCPYSEIEDEEENERELVSEIVLRFDDGNGLAIGWWLDFCLVYCIDNENQKLKIPFRNLKNAIYNWDDLHTDEVIGYEAKSSTVFFGRKGMDHVGPPSITFAPQNSESRMTIHVDNLPLLFVAFAYLYDDWFDIYDEYSFNYSEWHKILSVAEKVLSYHSYYKLLKYLMPFKKYKTFGMAVMVKYTDNYGKEIMENKEKYQEQLSDIKTWTKLALDKDGIINIIGS